MKKQLLLLLVLVTSTTSIFAQTPQGINYQTTVRDASGDVLMSQAVGTQLILHQATTTGTAVYTETWVTSTNAYGVLDFVFGTGTTTDDFSAIDWSVGPYFLETLVDVSGGTTYVSIGSSQLMSVPYAQFSQTAVNVINADDADADPANENNTTFELNGTSLDITDEGGTLSADVSSLLNTSDWTVSGNTIYNANSGSVGIGTPTPTGAFEVSSALPNDPPVVDQSQTSRVGAAGSLSQWQSFTAGISGLLTQVDLQVVSGDTNGGQNGTIRIYEGEGESGTLLATESVFFDNVLTTFQQFDLSIPPVLVAGNQYTIQFSIPTINVGWVYLDNTNPYAGGRGSNDPTWDYLFKTYISVQNPSSTTLLVDETKVGIGTTTPARTLHVNDVMRLEPRATAPSSPSAGDMYFDSVVTKLMVYDGATWQACW